MSQAEHPRKAIGGSKADDVLLARVLFADFDGVALDEVRRRIDEAGLPTPTLIVRSGHGFHCYWRLESPLHDLDEWTLYEKGLIAELDSDSCIHDAPRIMRLPPFVNHTEDDPAVCKIVESDAARVYPLDDFPRAAPKPKQTPRPRSKANARERRNAIDYLSRLNRARADEYDDWLSAGMALHSVDPSNESLAVWENWSKPSSKWEDGVCAEKWATFKSNGALTIATLHGCDMTTDPRFQPVTQPKSEGAAEPQTALALPTRGLGTPETPPPRKSPYARAGGNIRKGCPRRPRRAQFRRRRKRGEAGINYTEMMIALDPETAERIGLTPQQGSGGCG